ncbi:MAG TPA: hypothetical protein VHN20_12585 [Beijerinckiaceae bacterium]|nr:hypothetical protein [Beijerinckiaceae bacterium]
MVNLLVGILAGLVSALLAATVTAGPPLGVLAYLTPLPILIGALGWNHRSGLVAAAAGAFAVALAFAPEAGLAFLAGAMTIWWLAYLTLLGRPGPDGSLEWYPLGRLLLWITACSALLTLVVPIIRGVWDYDTYHAAAKVAAEASLRFYLRVPGGVPLPSALGGVPSDRLVEAMATALPFVASAFCTLVLTLNVWVAARTVAISGRLPRPWPAIARTRMPQSALAPMALAVAAAFLAGFTGIVALTVAGALAMAFALLGLALLHDVSRGRPGRAGLLVGAYLLVALLSHAVLPLLALAGMADTAVDLRRRLAPGGSGPRSST